MNARLVHFNVFEGKKLKMKVFIIISTLGIFFGVTANALWSQPQTIVRPVVQGTDDAGTNANGCTFSTENNEIYFGECNTGEGIVSGFRFQNIPISTPSEIEETYLEFTVDGPYSNDIHIRFYGEAADNSETFGNDSKPSDRALTMQSVDWSLTPADAWEWTTKHNSPDLSPILQEIVSRPGWHSDNAISIIVTNVFSNEDHRRVFSFEREGAASAARLIINAPPPPEYNLYTISPKVWVINFDPIIPSRDTQRLHQVFAWNTPDSLSTGYRNDQEEASYNLVRYRIVKVINANAFPVKTDGFRYTSDDESTPGSFLYANANNAWHDPDGVDYQAIVRDYDLARKLDAGEVDEIWLQGGPYFGYYESRMGGKGSYWCNSPPMERVAASKIFVLMGFNYERGVGEMLHDLGHRTEAIMTTVFGSWTPDSTHAWNRFTLYDQIWPGGAACGNTHFAPNSTRDYEYDNTTLVWSTHRDWLDNYPNLTGQKELLNAAEWGGGDMRLYHKWWFLHIPHVAGATTEYGMTRSNNWWHYIVDFNNFPESGDGRATGFFGASQLPGQIVQVTNNSTNDWAPQINVSGRIVWYGYDGSDYEIFSAFADGTDFSQLTNNEIDDENPHINDHGQVVWQSFDGGDYEIFTANQDGSNLTRLTDNQTCDWHPQINNSGRVVWDGWDGMDYEIFSANADGSDLVQITNNEALSGYPLEDVWPQINDFGRTVWTGYDGSDWEIFSANADGSELVQISTTNFDDEYPQINNADQVVWQTYHNDINVEIHSAGADGQSAPEVVISKNPLEDWYPRINPAGEVVWMGHNGLNWDIYRANFDGSNLVQLTTGPTDHEYPQIDETGFIVWQGYDGEDWEIFGWSNGTIYQLSNNDFDDRAPAVNNANAIWHGENGTSSTSDIYSLMQNPVFADPLSFTGIPKTFALEQNFPNPFNPETTIQYQLPKDTEVTLKIFNILGQRIKTLFKQKQAPGYHTIYWDGKDEQGQEVASGIYFLTLEAKDFTTSRKMLLIR